GAPAQVRTSGQFVVLGQLVSNLEPGRLGSHVDVVIGQAVGRAFQHAQADVHVLSFPNSGKQENVAAATPGAVTVGALTLDQEVVAAGGNLHLVDSDARNGCESRSGADATARAMTKE